MRGLEGCLKALRGLPAVGASAWKTRCFIRPTPFAFDEHGWDVARSRSEAETAAGNSDSATAPTRYRNTELHHGGDTLFVDSLRA